MDYYFAQLWTAWDRDRFQWIGEKQFSVERFGLKHQWLDEKWPLSSPEWDNEQQSESLWSSCTKKNQWDFIFVLTILIDRKEEDTVWESNKSHWQTWNRKSLANLLTVLTLHFSLLLQVFSWSFAGDSLKFALTFPYNLMLGYRWGENSALDFLRALAWLCVIWKDRAEALKPYKSFLNVNVTATATAAKIRAHACLITMCSTLFPSQTTRLQWIKCLHAFSLLYWKIRWILKVFWCD